MDLGLRRSCFNEAVAFLGTWNSRSSCSPLWHGQLTVTMGLSRRTWKAQGEQEKFSRDTTTPTQSIPRLSYTCQGTAGQTRPGL